MTSSHLVTLSRQVAAKDTEIGTWSDWSVAVHATPWIEDPLPITSTTEVDFSTGDSLPVPGQEAVQTGSAGPVDRYLISIGRIFKVPPPWVQAGQDCLLLVAVGTAAQKAQTVRGSIPEPAGSDPLVFCQHSPDGPG